MFGFLPFIGAHIGKCVIITDFEEVLEESLMCILAEILEGLNI
jgi:hypothetical protein